MSLCCDPSFDSLELASAPSTALESHISCWEKSSNRFSSSHFLFFSPGHVRISRQGTSRKKNENYEQTNLTHLVRLKSAPNECECTAQNSRKQPCQLAVWVTMAKMEKTPQRVNTENPKERPTCHAVLEPKDVNASSSTPSRSETITSPAMQPQKRLRRETMATINGLQDAWTRKTNNSPCQINPRENPKTNMPRQLCQSNMWKNEHEF